MIDLAGRPTVGPYVLTRELPSAGAFWASCGERASREVEAEHVSRFGQPLDGTVESRPNIDRTVTARLRSALGLGAHGQYDGPRDAARTDARVTAHGAPPAPERFAALHQTAQTSHVLYKLPPTRGQRERERVIRAVEAAAKLRHAHILSIDDLLWDPIGHPWLITPFTGDVDGVRPLARLLKEKHGQLDPAEAERAMEQLFDALRLAHQSPVVPAEDAHGLELDQPSPLQHGPILLDHVLVDRHGSLRIELFGLARLLASKKPGAISPQDRIRDEVRSVVEIGYQLITGLRAEEPMIPAGRLVKRLDPRWDSWFEHGLSAMRGFDSAQEALTNLPSHQPRVETERDCEIAHAAIAPHPDAPATERSARGGWSFWGWLRSGS